MSDKHEMTAREFLTAYKRMCASYPETDCTGCPLHTEYKDCMDAPCEWDIDKILPAVEQWAAEHLEKKHKTYAEDFIEKFPKSTISGECRGHLYGHKTTCCPQHGDCVACWNEEMEGGNE